MRIWLITVGEPLPLDGARDRLWRTGMLAELLADRGHEVLWWTSTVDHFRKHLFVSGEPRIVVRAGISIQFMSGRLYRRNVSIGRLLNHMQLGRRFAEMAPRETRPDIILASYPTIELSKEAVDFGEKKKIPVVVDVRDLWPDIFPNLLPGWLRSTVRLFLRHLYKDSAYALSNSDALFAVSEGYLEWGLSRGVRLRSAEDAVFPLAYQRTEWTSLDERALLNRLESCAVVPGIPLATFVGTFGRTYDLGTVIEAARLIAKHQSHRVQFVLCGTGEREEEWRRAAADVPIVAFPGWLDSGELACLLSRSAFGVAAYASGAPQGIPNKIIEYLSAGLPIFSSLEGETRRLLEVNGCGIHYAPHDPQSLAAGIEWIIDDAEIRAAMGAAASALFRRKFSAASVYGEMANHLERLVENGLSSAS